MRHIAPIKAAKICAVVVSSLLCLFGILLIVFPDISVSVLGTVFGILLVLFGGIRLFGYFSRDLFRLAFQYDLAFGILMVVLGGVLLAHPAGLFSFLCVVYGVSVLADGLFKLQTAFDARRFGLHRWWLILALALVSCAFGLALLFRPGEGSRILCMLLGLSMLSEGILNISTVITAMKIVRHQKKDILEGDFIVRDGESDG